MCVVSGYTRDAGKEIVLSFLNVQENPPIPVPELSVRLRLPENTDVNQILSVPDDVPVPYELDSRGYTCFTVRNIELFRMIRLECS